MSDEDPRVPDMRAREALLVHIEGLQATLTKRNQQIEFLKNEIASTGESEATQRAVKKAYKNGWQECAQRLMTATGDAARTLTTINSVAWKGYLEAERLGLADGVTGMLCGAMKGNFLCGNPPAHEGKHSWEDN